MKVRSSPASLWRAVDPQWLMLAGALPLGLLLYWARGSTLAEGQEIYVHFSLSTADKTAAMCATPEPIFERACRYRSPDQSASDGDRASKLQPFGTTRGVIYLVDDLFADPAVAARFASEPPQGKSNKQLKRFEARCSLRLLGRAPPVHIRWGKTTRWATPPRLWVGVPSDCTVIG
jgi:hypothetical protein